MNRVLVKRSFTAEELREVTDWLLSHGINTANNYNDEYFATKSLFLTVEFFEFNIKYSDCIPVHMNFTVDIPDAEDAIFFKMKYS